MNLNLRAGGNRRHLLLLTAGPALIVLVGGYFYLAGERYVSTDNAYLKSDKVSISAEVNGRVTAVDVEDNSAVKAGQHLLSIDRAPFEIAVAQAEANLAAAQADIESMRADYRQKKEQLAQAEDNVAYQEKEFARNAPLAKSNAIAQARFDEVRHARDDSIRSRDALKQELASEAAKIGGDLNTPLQEHPRYRQAAAALDKARLDLSHVDVLAPTDGVAANVTLRPGAFIAAGLPLFSLVEDKRIWIEANFKETDLTHVRQGQTATVQVDTYPGKTWTGTVESVTPATGSEFSILPAQNSSGNWVKVVQRLMVRINMQNYDGTPPLASGMSAYVTIDTGHSRLGRWFSSGE